MFLMCFKDRIEKRKDARKIQIEKRQAREKERAERAEVRTFSIPFSF